MKLTDDVKQRKQKHFKQYRTAKQKLTNKENLVRFLHRGKPKKKGLKAAFSKAQPDRLFINGKFIPVNQPFF